MKYFILLAVVLPHFVYAQKKITFYNSAELIKQGIEFHDKEKFDDAIDAYEKVTINDTNFALAQFEIGLSYIGKEEYKNAQEVLSELLNHKIAYNFKHLVYMQLGNAYDMDKQPEKAISVYTEGLKLMPYQHNLLYNRGVCYEMMGKFDLAIADYQSAILGNMYHAQSHARLGLLCARMGLYDQAMLSMMTAIWLEPTDPKSDTYMRNMEAIARGNFEEKAIDQVVYIDQNDPYADFNEFYVNKTALQNNYKVRLTVKTDYARQLDLFLKNNHYDANSTDFWNVVYMPFYDNLYKTKNFDNLILLSLLQVENQAIKAKVQSKIGKVTAFYETSKNNFFNFSENRYMNFEGKPQYVTVDYSGARLTSIGLSSVDPKTGQKTVKGNFYYYFPNGMLKMVAHVDDKGNPIGKWKINNEFDGKTEREIEFIDANTKIVYDYYASGEMYSKYKMINEKPEGIVEIYFRNGTIREKYELKAGVKNGNYSYFFQNGTLFQSLNYVDGLLDGPLKIYHPNGVLKTEMTMVKGLVQGKRTIYYPNKSKESEYNFVDDKYDGAFTTYYSTGQIQEEGLYKKGVQVGESKTYYSNGALKYTLSLDESGKQSGDRVNYDLDGKKYQKFEFSKGNLKKIVYIKKDGTEEVIAESKGKKMDYIRSFPNGKVNVKGQLLNDLYDGRWEYFDQYDNLWKVENYAKGDLVDTLIVYHSNGKVKSAYQIKNGDYNGLYLGYSIFGNLVVEGIYKDGEKDKEWYNYYEDGVQKSQNYYVNGEYHGYQIDYDVNGHISAVEQYDNGKLIFNRFLDTLENVLVEFGEFNGEVKIPALNKSYTRYVGHYLNGINDGVMTHYSSDGVVSEQINYVNDYAEGVGKWYFENGKIAHERHFLNGEINGKDIYYFENGNVSASYQFVDGERQGEFIDYHENGKVNFSGVYIDDERHGKVTSYGQKGEIAMFRYYDQGTIVAYSYLGTDGKEVTPIPLVGKEMNVVCYFQNGKKSIEHKRVNGLIEGPFILYHENGQKAEESNYLHGEENGKYTVWNDAGVKLYEKDYSKGDLHGWSITYYNNGKIQSKTPYNKGFKHGVASFYSPEGKLIKTITYYNNESLEIKNL